VRHADPPRVVYPGSVHGHRIATVNRGAAFTAGVYRFNRPWWRYHRAWYYGAWYNWPAYPAFWANLPGAYWLSPWWTGTTFVYDNPYYVYLLYPSENPYVMTLPRGLDYSTPLLMPTESQADRTDANSLGAALASMDRARADFMAGNYADATNATDRAVTLLPGDRSMQEFRALTLFARGEYDEAASAIYAVLSAGPGWNWETMIGLYPNVQNYTAHLRMLESHVRAYPTEARGHFLLGYHYLVMNDLSAAVNELRKAAKLSPRDKVSPAIVEALSR
jgi:tetratricopeptide (TPR) repeat protein